RCHSEHGSWQPTNSPSCSANALPTQLTNYEILIPHTEFLTGPLYRVIVGMDDNFFSCFYSPCCYWRYQSCLGMVEAPHLLDHIKKIPVGSYINVRRRFLDYWINDRHYSLRIYTTQHHTRVN
ncbi:hypothetical protein, partial [Collimonas antrihumi]|uniref:hypothetical protein n=1 Tax=Collimonas antrihumi TaxID=1940615 RepID=UPI001B8D82E6